MKLILGAGIGGLAAAAELKRQGCSDFRVVELSESLPLNLGNGVHYLHSRDLDLPFDFELKEVTATEELWDPRRDEFKSAANLPEMIDYSMKVMKTRHPSSIMYPGVLGNKAYLPPSSNMNDLLTAYEGYIGRDHFHYGFKLVGCDPRGRVAKFQDRNNATMSVAYDEMVATAPLPTMTELFAFDFGDIFFSRPIYVNNYPTSEIVANWLISLYISDAKFPVYRITVLNNIISMESAGELSVFDENIIKYHLERYFDYELAGVQKHTWKNGRIWGLSNANTVGRNRIVAQFAAVGVHLVGRFARWDGKLRMDTTVKQAQEVVRTLL